MPGAHNVRNALAALAVCLCLEVSFAEAAAALRDFGGVHRRFERLGTWRGAAVIDDYAHHPTEVAATLEAARATAGSHRVHAVFQPHLYSRTQLLAEDFGRALLAADHAVVLDVYGSREEPMEGVSGELVVQAAKACGHRRVCYCPDWDQAMAELAPNVQEGDLVLALGAGDVYRLAMRLVEEQP